MITWLAIKTFFGGTVGKLIIAALIVLAASGALYGGMQLLKRSGAVEQELKHERKATKARTKMQQAPVVKTPDELKQKLKRGEL